MEISVDFDLVFRATRKNSNSPSTTHTISSLSACAVTCHSNGLLCAFARTRTTRKSKVQSINLKIKTSTLSGLIDVRCIVRCALIHCSVLSVRHPHLTDSFYMHDNRSILVFQNRHASCCWLMWNAFDRRRKSKRKRNVQFERTQLYRWTQTDTEHITMSKHIGS